METVVGESSWDLRLRQSTEQWEVIKARTTGTTHTAVDYVVYRLFYGLALSGVGVYMLTQSHPFPFFFYFETWTLFLHSIYAFTFLRQVLAHNHHMRELGRRQKMPEQLIITDEMEKGGQRYYISKRISILSTDKLSAYEKFLWLLFSMSSTLSLFVLISGQVGIMSRRENDGNFKRMMSQKVGFLMTLVELFANTIPLQFGHVIYPLAFAIGYILMELVNAELPHGYQYYFHNPIYTVSLLMDYWFPITWIIVVCHYVIVLLSHFRDLVISFLDKSRNASTQQRLRTQKRLARRKIMTEEKVNGKVVRIRLEHLTASQEDLIVWKKEHPGEEEDEVHWAGDSDTSLEKLWGKLDPTSEIVDPNDVNPPSLRYNHANKDAMLHAFDDLIVTANASQTNLNQLPPPIKTVLHDDSNHEFDKSKRPLTLTPSTMITPLSQQGEVCARKPPVRIKHTRQLHPAKPFLTMPPLTQDTDIVKGEGPHKPTPPIILSLERKSGETPSPPLKLFDQIKSDPRHSDPRNSNPRNSNPRNSDPRHSDPRHSDPRHSDPRHSDPKHSDPRHSDPRHSDPRHSDPRHSDQRHSDPKHSDPNHSDPIKSNFPTRKDKYGNGGPDYDDLEDPLMKALNRGYQSNLLKSSIERGRPKLDADESVDVELRHEHRKYMKQHQENQIDRWTYHNQYGRGIDDQRPPDHPIQIHKQPVVRTLYKAPKEIKGILKPSTKTHRQSNLPNNLDGGRRPDRFVQRRKDGIKKGLHLDPVYDPMTVPDIPNAFASFHYLDAKLDRRGEEGKIPLDHLPMLREHPGVHIHRPKGEVTKRTTNHRQPNTLITGMLPKYFRRTQVLPEEESIVAFHPSVQYYDLHDHDHGQDNHQNPHHDNHQNAHNDNHQNLHHDNRQDNHRNPHNDNYQNVRLDNNQDKYNPVSISNWLNDHKDNRPTK